MDLEFEKESIEKEVEEKLEKEIDDMIEEHKERMQVQV